MCVNLTAVGVISCRGELDVCVIDSNIVATVLLQFCYSFFLLQFC